MNVDVAIIGAGVSGLATAWELKRLGYRVVVLERLVRPGGRAISERFGGFLMEHGPSTMTNGLPAARRLSRSLDIDGRCCQLGTGVRQRYLVAEGALCGLPIHALGLFTARYLSRAGRLRLLAEAVVPRRDDGGEESVEAFCARRFGGEFAERIMDPLVGGIFAGRADELSVLAAFPRLVELERRHGSILRGILNARLRGGKMPGRRLFSWRDGIGTLPRALSGALGSAVRTGVAVRRLQALIDGYRIDLGAAGALRARVVVIATQPHVTAQLLEGIDDTGAAAASSIEAPPLVVVFLGFRREQVAHPLDGLGFLAARAERRALTGAQFCSTMFPGRAPAGHVAVAGYIGGARRPDLARLPAADLIGLARAEFRDLLGARGVPVVARVCHWPTGLPQYRLGHHQRTAVLRGLGGRRPGLFLTGNYFTGPSIAACLSLAQETAVGVHDYLGQGERPATRCFDAVAS